jgi:hypothetical protein
VTTDKPNASGGTSRLWRLNFTNAREPDKGGTIDLLLDGTEGQNMRDTTSPSTRTIGG